MPVEKLISSTRQTPIYTVLPSVCFPSGFLIRTCAQWLLILEHISFSAIENFTSLMVMSSYMSNSAFVGRMVNLKWGVQFCRL